MGPDIPVWVQMAGAAAATVAGNAMQQQAQDEAADRTRQQIAANQALDSNYQKKAIDLVTQNADQYKPEERQQNEQQSIDTAQKSLTGSLIAAREDQAAPAATSGKVSNDFTTGQATTAANELQRSTNIARLMARMRGPSDMRAGEAMANADFAGQGGSLANDRGAMAAAGNTDVGTIQPDGTQMLLGGAAQQVGMGALANGLMKKAKPAATMGQWTSGEALV